MQPLSSSAVVSLRVVAWQRRRSAAHRGRAVQPWGAGQGGDIRGGDSAPSRRHRGAAALAPLRRAGGSGTDPPRSPLHQPCSCAGPIPTPPAPALILGSWPCPWGVPAALVPPRALRPPARWCRGHFGFAVAGPARGEPALSPCVLGALQRGPPLSSPPLWCPLSQLPRWRSTCRVGAAAWGAERSPGPSPPRGSHAPREEPATAIAGRTRCPAALLWHGAASPRRWGESQQCLRGTAPPRGVQPPRGMALLGDPVQQPRSPPRLASPPRVLRDHILPQPREGWPPGTAHVPAPRT